MKKLPSQIAIIVLSTIVAHSQTAYIDNVYLTKIGAIK
jgi:hypothetical protein